MKKLLLIVILGVISGIDVFPQPEITVSNHLPSYGDCYHNAVFTEYRDITPGGSGPGQVWDYSKLPSPTTNNSVSTFMDPEGTPYYSQVPECNLSIKTGDNFYQYLKTTSSGYEWHSIMMNGVFGIYTDPMTILELPFSYLDEFSDSYDYTIHPGEGMTSHFYGTVHVVADAYGTIITPFGTFDNVLRVARAYENHCVTTVGTISIPMADSTYEYQWYAENIAYPVLSMALMPDSVGVYDVIYITDYTTTGIFPGLEKQAIMIFPNPANEKIIVSVDQPLRSIIFYDISGRAVRAFNNFENKNLRSKILNIKNLKSGTYLMTVTFLSGSRMNGKIVIQH